MTTATGKDEDSLFTLVKSSSKPVNRHQVIREILDGLTWDGWTFPTQSSGDGCMGINTISASRHVAVTGASDQLALHLNFMIACQGMTKSTKAKQGIFKIKLTLLHVTARATKTQVTISDDGSSILTAAGSIHCGPGNDWDWTDSKVTELTLKLGGVAVAAVQTALQGAGFNPGKAYMQGARTNLKAAILAKATHHYPRITFEVTEEDNTWKE